MTSVEEFMLSRFLVAYGPPETTDEDALVAEYVKEIGNVPVERIKAATDELIRTHVYRNWPTVAECLRAINVVRMQSERMNELHRLGNPGFERRREPTAAAKSRHRNSSAGWRPSPPRQSPFHHRQSPA